MAGTLVLKDLIDAVYILTQQLKLSEEKRNKEIITKIYNRLNESLEGYDGKEKVIASLQGFFKMLSIV